MKLQRRGESQSNSVELSLSFSTFSPLILSLLLISVFQQAFHISRQTFREFNHYLVVMVNCLWNSNMFRPGMGVQLGEEVLLKSNVPQYWTSFDLVHHPAFMSYAVDFHQRVSVNHLGCLDLYFYRDM